MLKVNRAEIRIEKVVEAWTRVNALQVIEEVYLKEKNWISTPENEISENPINSYGSWPTATTNPPA